MIKQYITQGISFVINCAMLILVLVNVKAFALTMNHPFTTESELPAKYSNQIQAFWLTGRFAAFKGLADTRINYAAFSHEEKKQCIVVVPGRSESYLKYQELAFDIFHQGFNVFIIDHRGQGLSQRLLSDQHKGFVEHFDHYAEDLHTFVENHVKQSCASSNDESGVKPYLLAHSMGGTIALRMMQLYPNLIKSAVLASPMIAINSGNLPNALARTFIKTATLVNSILPSKPWYFLGQKRYQPTPFSENELTQSIVRYQHYISTYEKTPKVQLGGVTFKWLSAALEAQKLIFTDIEKLATPITILQASEDTVVDNTIQNDFCHQLSQHQQASCPHSLPIVVEGAMHELFNEQDRYRVQAITHALAWFKKFP